MLCAFAFLHGLKRQTPEARPCWALNQALRRNASWDNTTQYKYSRVDGSKEEEKKVHEEKIKTSAAASACVGCVKKVRVT